MTEPSTRKGSLTEALLDLLACIGGFGAAALMEYVWIKGALPNPEAWVFTALFSAVIAWFAMVFPESQWHEGLRLWVDGFFTVVAFNLLVQSGLIYLFAIAPASWLVIVLGSVLSMSAVALVHKWFPNREKLGKGIVFVGSRDIPVDDLHDALGQPILGGLVSGQSEQLQAGVPFLGRPGDLPMVCEQIRPGTLVVSGKTSEDELRTLLQAHYSGVEVESALLFYERVLQRVPWRESRPSDLLFSLNPAISRAMLAFQAVYKNVIGLGLRVITAPLMILISVLVVVLSGAPSVEQIECLGFQRTPFLLLRFRIHDSHGNLTGIGKLIKKLHLTNLPHLINVVRGEMTLFGPAPVRTAFANRLMELMPAYIYRFTVKPGIFGWYQVHHAETGGLPDEVARLEYDLYYIKQESPSLDLDILLRTLFRRSSVKPAPPDAASRSAGAA
jgi:lipopolysaccharide/colanic/teichoic acid biosynthesis glycosyltransferase